MSRSLTEATDSNRYWYWVRVSVAIGGLIFLLSTMSLGRVQAALSSSRLELVGLALVATLLSRLASSYRLRVFANSTGHPHSVWHFVRINMTAVFYSLFLPGGNVTANAIRVLRMRDLRVPTSDAGAAVVRDRLDSALFLVLTGLLFLLLDSSSDLGVAATPLTLLACAAIGVLVLIVESPLARRVDDLLARLDMDPLNGRIGRVWRAIRRTGDLSPSSHLLLGLASLGAHLMSTAGYFFLSQSLGLELSFIEIGWIRVLVILLTMIPVSLGGIGVREAGFVVILSTKGIGAEPAVALSLLVFLVTILVVGVSGGILDGFDFASPSTQSDRGTSPRREGAIFPIEISQDWGNADSDDENVA